MGASRFRIDMVAEHPKKPGRYVLAIECDGATYHSSYTARDRDRLRQQQLENLGWRFHRIWSTDWFMRKEDEIQRALSAFDESVEFAEKLDGGVVQNNHSNGVHRDTSSTALRRGPRPPVPMRTSISEYREGALIQLLKWIASDGLLRTDDQIIDEMIPTLGFSRRGARIESAIIYDVPSPGGGRDLKPIGNAENNTGVWVACRSELGQNFPADDARRANISLIVTNGDVLGDWIASVIEGVRDNAISILRHACVDFCRQFTLIIANLHLTPP
jgi:hypothetical protein